METNLLRSRKRSFLGVCTLIACTLLTAVWAGHSTRLAAALVTLVPATLRTAPWGRPASFAPLNAAPRVPAVQRLEDAARAISSPADPLQSRHLEALRAAAFRLQDGLADLPGAERLRADADALVRGAAVPAGLAIRPVRAGAATRAPVAVMQAEAGRAGAQEQRAEIRIDAEVLAECLAECQEDGQAECQEECQLGSFQGHVDHDSGHKGRHMDHESGHVLGSPAQEEEHPLDPRTQAGVDHFRLQKRKFDRLPDLEVPGHSAQTEEHPLDPRIYWMNKLTVDTIKGSVDMFYNGRDFARFYVLETVARVPYFAYLSVLHCRETLGVRAPDLRERMRTHYAESDNELHHLLIMESLGGNAFAADRAIAQTLAFFYYWYVVAVYSLSEQAAYHLSELIEDHAYATYDNFLKENEARLRAMPVPDVARQYYEADSPCWFDQFCTTAEPGTPPRRRELEDGCCMTCPEDKFDEATGRPRLASLYDVFVNVRNDEREHWKTLCNLVQYDSLNGPVRVVAPSKPDAAKME